MLSISDFIGDLSNNVQFITLTHLRPSLKSFFHNFRPDIRTITFYRIYPICRNVRFTENKCLRTSTHILHNKKRKKTPHDTRTVATSERERDDCNCRSRIAGNVTSIVSKPPCDARWFTVERDNYAALKYIIQLSYDGIVWVIIHMLCILYTYILFIILWCIYLKRINSTYIALNLWFYTRFIS